MATIQLRSLLATRLRPFLEVLAAEPVKSLVLSIGPLALAVGQVLNGYVNGLSPRVSLPFAVVLTGFAVIATRHHVRSDIVPVLRPGPS